MLQEQVRIELTFLIKCATDLILKKELAYDKAIHVDGKLTIMFDGDRDNVMDIDFRGTFTTENTDSSTVTRAKQEEVKNKISNKILHLCKNGLNTRYKKELRILGPITVDLANDKTFRLDIRHVIR